MKVAETKTAATTAKSDAPFFQKGIRQGLSHTTDNEQPFFQKKGNDFPTIQAKLNIGKPNDKYEVEADAVADKVIQRLSNKNTIDQNTKGENIQAKPIAPINTTISSIQTKCTTCEQEEKLQKKEVDEDLMKGTLQKKPIFESNAEPQSDDEKNVQRKCSICEQKEELLQTKGQENAGNTSSSIETSLLSSKGGGSEMNAQVKNEMESSFGLDFSAVRIHNNSAAIQMNKDLSAQAFTHGSDIYFNEGKYNPESKSGKHLLAHELTHTVQQGALINKKENVPTIQKVPATEEQKQTIRNTLAGLGVRIDDANAQEIFDHYPDGISAERQVVYVLVGGENYGTIARLSAIRLNAAVPLPAAVELFVFEVGKGRSILLSSIGGGSIMLDAGAGGANTSNSTSARVLATHVSNLTATGIVAAPSAIRLSHIDADHYNALSSILNLPAMGNAVVEVTRQQLTQAIAQGNWNTMNVQILPSQSIVQINVRGGSGLDVRLSIIGNMEITEYRSEAAHTALATPGQRTYNKNNTSPVTIMRDRVTNSTYVMTGDAQGRLLNEVVNMVGEDAFRRIAGGGARNLAAVELPHHGGAVNSGPDVAGMTRFLRLMFEASNGTVNFFAQTSANFSSSSSASIRYLNDAQIPTNPVMDDPNAAGVRNIRAGTSARIVLNGNQIASIIAMGNSNSSAVMEAYQMRDRLLTTTENLAVMESTFRMISGEGENLSAALGTARTESETHQASLNTSLNRYWTELANAAQSSGSGMRASANTTQLRVELANVQTSVRAINVEAIENSIAEIRNGMSTMGRVFLNSLSMQQALRFRDTARLNTLKAEQRGLVNELLSGARAELGRTEFHRQIGAAWQNARAGWNQSYVQRVAVRMGISEAQSRQILFRSVLATNLSRQMQLNELARRAEAGTLPSVGAMPMRTRVGAGIMAAIELARIGFEFYESYEAAEIAEAQRDRERRIQGLREVYWWINMGVRPNISLVGSSWGSATTLNTPSDVAYTIINEEMPEAERPEYDKVVVDYVSDEDLLTVVSQFYLRFMTMGDWIEAMGNPEVNDRNTVSSSGIWFIKQSDGWRVKLWDSEDNEYKLSLRPVIQQPLEELMVHLRQGQTDETNTIREEHSADGTSTIEDSAWIFGTDRIAFVYNSYGNPKEIDFDDYTPTFVKYRNTDTAFRIRGDMTLVRAANDETYNRLSRYYWVTVDTNDYWSTTGSIIRNYTVNPNHQAKAYVSTSTLIKKDAPTPAH
jgi:DNA-directed RNA polymerase subunit M/transcription elongation factor TFIIS